MGHGSGLPRRSCKTEIVVKRVASFDIIRALAIIGIVLAHQLLTEDVPSLYAVGKWFGATFSVVFLGLSALVLGWSWVDKGKPVYGARFLLHRLSRLAVPYWLFLTIFLLTAYAQGHVFPWKDILMNYAFLGWLAKIPGIGHLWFVTMIVICYVACVVVCHLSVTELGRRLFPWALFLACGGLYGMLYRLGLPAYMAVILFYYCLLFAFADRVLAWLHRHGKMVFGVGIPLLALLIAGQFLSGLLTSGKENMIVCSCSLCGIAILLLLHTAFARTAVCPRAVSSVSGISYEWFLVHHPMIIGPLALTYVLPRPMAVALYWLLSLCFAFVLHYLSSFVYKLFRA